MMTGCWWYGRHCRCCSYCYDSWGVHHCSIGPKNAPLSHRSLVTKADLIPILVACPSCHCFDCVYFSSYRLIESYLPMKSTFCVYPLTLFAGPWSKQKMKGETELCRVSRSSTSIRVLYQSWNSLESWHIVLGLSQYLPSALWGMW